MNGLLNNISKVLLRIIGKRKIQKSKIPVTVPYLDIARYSGSWYEISSIPQYFERGCTNVKATYTPAQGYILVHNQSLKNGGVYDIKGKAFVVPNSGNAKLKVQFFWPLRSDYWIVDLDNEYQWAVVSSPKRSVMWILSRTAVMDERVYALILRKLTDAGFDCSKLQMMPQK